MFLKRESGQKSLPAEGEIPPAGGPKSAEFVNKSADTLPQHGVGVPMERAPWGPKGFDLRGGIEFRLRQGFAKGKTLDAAFAAKKVADEGTEDFGNQ